jgi:predicted transcriptional regulator
MPRPKDPNPTPAELEVLQILWQQGPSTVRQVMEQLGAQRPRGYTTVMSLMEVMYDKGMLSRKQQGRAYVYAPRKKQAETLGKMLHDLLRRAYQGSSSALVSHLLDQASPDAAELREIRRMIENHERRNKGASS